MRCNAYTLECNYNRGKARPISRPPQLPVPEAPAAAVLEEASWIL